MPGPDQKIKTVLIPEIGLELDPEFIQQSIVTPDFSRVFAHLVGYAANRGILIRATSDGSLKVVSAGTPFEEYIVFSGTGGADYAAPNIKTYEVAYNVTDILVESFPAIISFRNLQGVWLDPKVLPVGYHSIDFIHYGYQIKRRTDAGDTDFEVTIYR
ncbi:hypothetical protein ES705_16753 [subsurface metagenome]|jgi:hypothetical protein